MLDGTVVPRWVSHLLSELREATFVELALVIVPSAATGRSSARDRIRGLLFSLYQAADYRAFLSSPDAFELVDETSRLRSETPVLEVATTSEEPFAESELEVVRAQDLDVVLWLSEPPPRGGILRCSRHGVWTLRHGDPEHFREEPPFFWELFDGETVSTTVVEVWSDHQDRQPKQIYSSRSAIHPQSLYQSRNSPYWKSAQFMLRCLKDLAAEDGVARESRSPDRSEGASDGGPRGIPSNAQMLFFLTRLFARGTRSRLRRLLYREHWFLAYREKRGPELAADMQDCTVVPAPRGLSGADPFVVYENGRHHVFFEEFSAQEARGQIAHFELLPGGSTTGRETVLKRPYHLSYPFVFARDGEMYMLPETASNRSIELYRAEEFPTTWRLERALISDVTAVDPTLLEHADRLWLFANVKEYGAPYSDELCLFFADSLDGPWTPHPENPIVSDVRSARPAGRIFEHDGALIRPGQDSSGRYGRAVTLNRIDILTVSGYRETTVGRIEPSWRPRNLGTHTYNFDDLYEVVDGREWEPRFRFAFSLALRSKPARRRHEQVGRAPEGDL